MNLVWMAYGAIAALTVLSAAGLIVALAALRRARAAAHASEDHLETAHSPITAAFQVIEKRLVELAAHVAELEQQPAVVVSPAAPKPCMNLSKRSQALRLDRRGDSAEQIARTLELPLQEVELLLKVQRIRAKSTPTNVPASGAN